MIGRSTSTCAGALISTQTFKRSDSSHGKLGIQRVAFHQSAGAVGQRVLLAAEVLGEGGGDDRGDLAHVVLDQAARRERRGAYAQAGGVHRRPLVEGDRVAVYGDPHLLE